MGFQNCCRKIAQDNPPYNSIVCKFKYLQIMNKGELCFCSLKSVSMSQCKLHSRLMDYFFSKTVICSVNRTDNSQGAKQSSGLKQAIADAISHITQNWEQDEEAVWRTLPPVLSSFLSISSYLSHCSDLFLLSSFQFCSPSTPNSFLRNSTRA